MTSIEQQIEREKSQRRYESIMGHTITSREMDYLGNSMDKEDSFVIESILSKIPFR